MDQVNGDYKFRIVRNIHYRLNQKRDEIVYTYEIQFKTIGEKEFTVEISNFSYTDYAKNQATPVVRNMIEQYDAVFFPVLLDIKEDTCFIKNKGDIIKRLESKNNQLRVNPKYLIDEDTAKIKNITRHHVIYDIKGAFLRNAIDDYILENSCSKGIMELLLFSLNEIRDYESYDLLFNLSPFNEKIKWECKKISEDDIHSVIYIGQIKDRNELFEQFEKYAKLEGYWLNKIEGEKLIYSELKHEVHFDLEKSLFDFFEMNVKIKHDFYDYKETIYISAINKK
jgi:hypothetical protein